MIQKSNKIIDITKIRGEITNLKKNLLNLYFQKSTGQLEKTAEIRKVKKNIARLKTQISQNNRIKNA